ncbi:restriction endonuclease subunit S [Kocuria marina subsp. indica]|uniref:restriction endonuclease subunit S n=1 Tax=Kocuria TaxID=57493 RepID=UPI0010386454|nr:MULTISPECIES: restriction endonuclease subunit S [Kocuria]MDT0120940.1 restriction endonuclease subunit S [Kocuria sp. PD6]QBJ20797.1 restriction endonuclease subunit S [Kocuria indica]
MSTATWPTRRLGDIASMGSGGTPSRTVSRYFGGGIPWVSITDMTNSGKYVSSTATTLTAEGLKSSAARLYAPNVVLYAMYASLGEVCVAVGRISSSQAILGIQPGAELDREFLYYHLEAIKPRVKELGQQGTQANLNAGMVRDFKVQLPPMAEQRKISGALRDADDLIATIERLIAKKQAIKQGVTQQLLTGRTRLPGFDKPWINRRLADVGQTVRGVGYKPDIDLSARRTAATVDLLRANNVQDSSLNLSDVQYVHRRRVRADQYLRTGDVLICAANGSKQLVGKAAPIRATGSIPQTFGAFMMVYRPNTGAILPSFAALHFQTKPYRDWIEVLLAGSSINNLRPADIAALEIPLPEHEEQVAIASAVTDMEDEIHALRHRLTKAHAIKQGMMQQLLTGRIRLAAEVAS